MVDRTFSKWSEHAESKYKAPAVTVTQQQIFRIGKISHIDATAFLLLSELLKCTASGVAEQSP